VRSTTAESQSPSGRRRAASGGLARAWIAAAATAALAVSGLAYPAGAAAQAMTAAAPAAAGAAGTTAAPAASAAARASAGHARDYRRACSLARRAGQMSCMVLILTTAPQSPQAALGPGVAPANDGYGPASLQGAYNLPSSTAGSGQTVAIVDAFDDPNAASDLATYRSSWGLPACGTGCFQKINQNGQASPLPSASGSSGWATEESLDLDMVSAICPSCHILLVEANSATTASLGTAVNTAVGKGAKYVSNSYGGPESSADPSFDSQYYQHPGVAVTASAGDSGYGVSYPAASQYVTAVGGTALTTAANSRGWTESAWGSSAGGEGTGSGCSADDAKPAWQTDSGCALRTDNDVAADADPNTGVAIYDTYDQGGWLEVGGTSAASPIIASVFALAGPPAAGSYPSSYPYARTSSLFDVTSGADGSCGGSYLCTARTGYDGPTGWGTPDGTAAFTSGATTGNTITVTNPGSQAGKVGTAASLQISATDSASGQTLTYSATGLPAGLSINSSTGLITGTPTATGAGSVTVTVTDTTEASGSASFTWTISASTSGCAAAQLLGNPGFETGSISPWTSTSGVLNRAASGRPAHSGSWLARLDGYRGAHTDTLAQTITIPSGCQHATFSFWLDIQTDDPTGPASDTLAVQVLSTSGRVLAALATYSNRGSTGYSQRSFSLAPYIGQKVTLKFTGKEALARHVTSFLVDDNALNVS
jgi:Putative Ig domain